LECHNGTVTDDFASALSFFRECGADNVSGFWQPNQFRSEAYNKEAAEAYAPFCNHIHVFHWDSQKRYPLAMGESVWKDYLRIFRGREKNVSLMLECMHNDDIGSLRETAETLRRWINEEEKRQ
ncbi:MAG: hypothetical protein MJ078_08255, partial [Clostridia bacterium]|nr:hypothetical protein [Clostridia bacterium]